MTYSLRRTRDGAGDSGPSMIINRRNPDTNEYEYERGVKPRVGWAVQVGSIAARSYAAQDFWQTTYVSEILEERDDYVRFKTGNSEYEWSIF
jgi:hypothetical protein